MVTKKTTSCNCIDCKCDPCECRNNACCWKSAVCSSSWCNWGAALRITIAVGMIVGAFFLGMNLGSHEKWEYRNHKDTMRESMEERSQEMPGMQNNTMSEHTPSKSMNMSDPMSMSMRDMDMMLVGQTGDALDRAFLEGMIPHHQGAVDMAQYLVNAKHPELRKMGQEIILAQEKEITQMKQWMIDWWYTSTGTTISTGSLSPQDEMMRDHCQMMPDMVGCEQYKK